MENRKASCFSFRRIILRCLASVLLASVYLMLVNWGVVSFTSLAFARKTTLLSFVIILAICFEILSALAMSLQVRFFDYFMLAYASIFYLFLIVAADVTTSLALGILGLLLIVGYLLFPGFLKVSQEKASRPYALILVGLLVPLVLLIFYRLFSSVKMSAFITQKDVGINLISQIVLIVFMGSAVGVLLYEWQPKEILGPKRPVLLASAVTLAAALHVLLVGGILVYRYWSLKTSTYDFGLFSQMFTYLKETGLPLTTLERNGLLSHYAVHLSPIFYLLLPFYWIWPDPATLQVLQPLVVSSGVIPLVLIARHHKLAPGWQILLAFVFVFHPGLIGSSLYDLHENCFLAPLLLWVVYWFEKDLWPGILISSLLVLAIKEDAALYLIAIAFYMIIARKKLRWGLVVLILAAAYFVVALNILARIGSGPMIGRFDNLMADPKLGLLSVPLTLLKNPAYLLSQVFTEEKIIYLVKMLLPVGFLPVLNRRLSSWILLVPFVVMNLIIDYPYQYVLRYQYHYGSSVLLIYLLILQMSGTHASASASASRSASSNASSNAGPPAKLAGAYPGQRTLTLGVGIALIASLLFGSILIKNSSRYFDQYYDNFAQLATIKAALDGIPEEASVQASPFLTSYLFRHKILYDAEKNLSVAVPHRTEYVIIDMRGISEARWQELVGIYQQLVYGQTEYIAGHVLILQNQAG